MFYRHAKLFLIVLCYANLALALPNDRDQAISLAADNATFNEKTGLAVYTGNVEIKQGSLLIQAEQITATTDKNGKILTITATGKPARMQQQPSIDKGIATAQADEISYQAQDGLISLKRNAMLQQAGSTFKSLEILYSMDKGEIEAKGNTQNRVQLVFPPPPKTDKKSKKLGETPFYCERNAMTLCAKNLAKSYKGRAVVKDVGLTVEKSQIVGLLGPNGAGKTTSFYMIVGLVPMDKGQISLDNQDISFLSMHQRARRGIGYLPQEASIFRKLTVEQNILAILETRQDLSSSQRQQKANDLLEEFHITHIRHSLGMSLSGGERRRVEIARALATEPSFILLDEPFAGVDPISVADIKGIISHLKNRGIGVLITDHHVRETLDICEKAYIVNSGVMIAEGTPKEILANETVRQVYLGQSFSL